MEELILEDMVCRNYVMNASHEMTHHTSRAHYFSFGVKAGVRFWCSHVLTCFPQFSNMFLVFLWKMLFEVPKLHFHWVNPIETLKSHEMLKFWHYLKLNKVLLKIFVYDFFPPSHPNIIIWFCSTHIFKSS
jgi:hypothetical protein